MTPQPLTLNLPPAAKVSGELYDTLDPAYLTQDILQVELGDGLFIDVSWYPEHDVAGRYHCRVFRDEWENTIGDRYTRHALKMQQIVQKYIDLYGLRVEPCDA